MYVVVLALHMFIYIFSDFCIDIFVLIERQLVVIAADCYDNVDIDQQEKTVHIPRRI